MNLMADIARIGRIPQWRVEEILRAAEEEARAVTSVRDNSGAKHA